MKCQFRIDVEFEYVALAPADNDKDTEPSYLEKAQRQRYPDCIEDECPFYNYGGACNRIEGD